MPVAGLVGTWTLVGWHEQDGDGAVLRHPFGEPPRGRLIYTAGGTMMGMLSAADRPPFASHHLERATEAEKAAAASTFVTYSGTYRVDGDRVVHAVDLSLFPNWVGTDLVRLLTLDGDDLTLRTETAKDGTCNVLTWRRDR